MVQYSSDIRETVRSKIGYSWDRDSDGNMESTVSVLNDMYETVYIPLLLPGEFRSGELPYMPAVEMTLVSATQSTVGIGGGVRHGECYFDFNIYYTNEDNISCTTFGRTVADHLCELIHTNRTSVSSAYFVEVVNSGREIIEPTAEGVVFHLVVECKGLNYI